MARFDLNKQIGLLIKRHRENAKLSQKELGLKIGKHEDQAQQYIYKYERGLISIPADNLLRIAVALNLHIEEFFPKLSNVDIDTLIELSISNKIQ